MQLPTGYYDPNKIALLLKTLYGLKQSARQWANLFRVALKKTGLKPLYSNFSVYVRDLGTAKMVIIAIYVGDILSMDSVIPDHTGQLAKPVSFSRMALISLLFDSSAMTKIRWLFVRVSGVSGVGEIF